MNSIIVIGGGPAGMMAAITAAGAGSAVTLIEQNARMGRKLMITGKGRCNITNNCDRQKLLDNVAVNPKFLYSAFSAFSPQDAMSFFEGAGVPLKTERGGRVFPQSDKAADINDALVAECRRRRVKFVTAKAENLDISDDRVTGVYAGGRLYKCDRCIIACGGASYPATGSDGSGYELARLAGHTVTKLSPSLVPMITEEVEPAEMQGLSLKNIAITVSDSRGKRVYTDFGELLFTHFGLSGPVVLSASSHMKDDERYRFAIDLKPALTLEQLDKRLQRDFSENPNKDFSNSLIKLLPRSMISVIINRSGISPETKVNGISREARRKLSELLKCYTLTVTGFRPISEAIVTSGGVSVREIDPKTMRSKLIDGLYFAGEIIDVDAHTGGFNLQIAMSTGYVAGMSAAE